MFIAMPVGQNISLEIVVFSGTVIGVIDSSQLQGKVAQSHLAYQTSFIFVRQGIFIAQGGMVLMLPDSGML